MYVHFAFTYILWQRHFSYNFMQTANLCYDLNPIAKLRPQSWDFYHITS